MTSVIKWAKNVNKKLQDKNNPLSAQLMARYHSSFEKMIQMKNTV